MSRLIIAAAAALAALGACSDRVEPAAAIPPAATAATGRTESDEATEMLPVEPELLAKLDPERSGEPDPNLDVAVDIDITDAPLVLASSGTTAAEPIRWVHPLAGTRALPGRPSRQFGAARDGSRPPECGAGHCGIDIGHYRGETVHAAATGRVARMSREPIGRAGRFIVLSHPGGIESTYVHLDEIRLDLAVGEEVDAGEPIGTLGRSGIVNSGAHLHFAVSRWLGGKRTFLDAEPILAAAAVLPVGGSIQEARAGSPVVGVAVPDAAIAPVPAVEQLAVDAISIAVRDQHTGRPVAGARVDARGADGARKTGSTGTDGRAHLPIADGSWKLTVSAPGYVTERTTSDGANRTVSLARGAILAGVVRDSDGERIAGARVAVGAATTTSDSAGRFRLHDAPTGAIVLSAELDDRYGETDLELAPGDEYVTLQIDIR